jgi:hypothetical protein
MAISPGSPARPATTTASRPVNPSGAGREAADGAADGAGDPVGAGAAGDDAGDEAGELHAARTATSDKTVSARRAWRIGIRLPAGGLLAGIRASGLLAVSSLTPRRRRGFR